MVNGYPPMIILQVRGVQQSLRFHLAEWGTSLLAVAWGLVVVKPGDVFAPNPAWRVLGTWAPELAWGWAFLLLGLIRIIVLVKNGDWEHWGHQARCWLAGVAVLFWAAIECALWSSGVGQTGLVAYALPLGLDLWVVRNASFDAERYKEAHPNGAT